MASLHIINSHAANGYVLSRCIASATSGDAVLLIGDGVYCAVADLFALAVKRPKLQWFGLQADADARGLLGRLADTVELIDDARFVELVVAHQPIVTWSA